jgi:predicted porin
MKKTLIALAAAFAAGGSAFAQTAVYGVVDLAVQKVTGADAGIVSGGYSGSRLGVKGSTDLGGGLKGNYMMDTGLDAANGGTPTTLGNRGVSAGVSGDFGSISFGRLFTPFAVSMFNDPLEYDGFSTLYGGSVQADHVWQSNSVLYRSPSMSGLTVSGMYSGSSGSTDAVKGPAAGTYMAVGGNYVMGPVTVDAAYESSKVTSTSVTTTGWHVSGLYNAGVATLYGALQGGDNGGANKQTAWDIGAGIPLGEGLAFQAGYYSVKVVNTDSVTSAVLVKEWNKQTRIYGGAVMSSMSGVDSTKVKAGLRYSF